jgi:hypothetical protein
MLIIAAKDNKGISVEKYIKKGNVHVIKYTNYNYAIKLEKLLLKVIASYFSELHKSWGRRPSTSQPFRRKFFIFIILIVFTWTARSPVMWFL